MLLPGGGECFQVGDIDGAAVVGERGVVMPGDETPSLVINHGAVNHIERAVLSLALCVVNVGDAVFSRSDFPGNHERRGGSRKLFGACNNAPCKLRVAVKTLDKALQRLTAVHNGDPVFGVDGRDF